MASDSKIKGGLPPFVPLFIGLREHLGRGKMTPMDLGIYVALHLNCDFETGICYTNAPGIVWMFGGKSQFGANENEATTQKKVQKSLSRLRQRAYINYESDGTRNFYPILINKYLVRMGRNAGKYLDAFAPGSLTNPVFISGDAEYSNPFDTRGGRGVDTGPTGDGHGAVMGLTGDAQETVTGCTGGAYGDYINSKEYSRVQELRAQSTEGLAGESSGESAPTHRKKGPPRQTQPTCPRNAATPRPLPFKRHTSRRSRTPSSTRLR